jgi:hypothetical protein
MPKANMRYRSDYPRSLSDVLDPPVAFRRETVAAVRRFARSRPWRGTADERKGKFDRLHRDLCAVYRKGTALRFGSMDGGCSGGSYFSPARNEIVLNGRLSVISYLHELAHALGRDERGSVRWSVNLFRLCFPRSFSRCVAEGHMVRRPQTPA